MQKKNILIDGNNLLHRAIYSSKNLLERTDATPKETSDGIDCLPLQKFLTDLFYMTEQFQSAHTEIYVVWDRKLEPETENWRKAQNPAYKSNRDTDDNTEQRAKVHQLCVHLKKLLDAMGVHSIYPLVSEGDDIIHYLSKNLVGGSIIVSADQDFYQCVSPDIWVYNFQKKFILTPENFEEHVPVAAEHYVRYKSIKGDPSDNLAGLYRFGEVKAKKLVENWEEESAKLTPEQLDILKKTEALVDLNHKPLSLKEKAIVQKQLDRCVGRKDDTVLTRIMDDYRISLDIRMKWDKFFKQKDRSQEEQNLLQEMMA